MAIPDSPDRNAWSRNHNAYPQKFHSNIERAKSESPELSMSLREYPSSQPPTPEEPPTSAPPTSSQPTSSCVQKPIRRDDNPQSLPGHENTPEVHPFSPHADGSSTNLSSHRGYQFLKSVQEARPSQIDPIESDDNLSQEKAITSRTTTRKSLRSPPTTSTLNNSARKPFLDGVIDDRSNGHLRGAEGPLNMQIELENEAAVPSVASNSIQSSIGSKESPQLPLNKNLSNSQARFHIAPHGASHDSMLGPQHEGIANTSEDQPLNKTEITNGRDLIMSEDQLGNNPSKAIPNSLVTEPTSCLQTVEAKDRIRDQVQHVNEGAEDAARLAWRGNTPTHNTDERNDGRVKKRSEPGTGSESLSKQVPTGAGPTRHEHEVEINTDSQTGLCPDTEHHPHEEAIRQDSPASGRGKSEPLEADEPEQAKVSKPEQKPATQAPVATPRKRSRTEGRPITSAGISLEEPQATSAAKRKTKAAAKNERIGDIGTPTGHKLDATSTIMPNSEEKLQAEAKAKRQADAIAYFIAKDNRRQGTPSSTKSSKQKSSKSNLATESPVADASVQSLRKPTVANSERSSSPSVNSDSVGKRRSMTPLFPSLIRPTKSALRTSSSSTCRSVSFNDDPIAPPGLLSTASSKLPRSKLRDTNDALEPDAEAKGSKSHSPRLHVSHSKPSNEPTPVKKKLPASEPASRTIVGRKAATPGQKPKVQSKLTVTRDVKLKGRAEGPAERPTHLKQNEDVISSDSENSASTFYSDDEDQPRNAKAGPSKKRRLTKATKPAAAASAIELDKQQQPLVAMTKVEGKPSVTSKEATTVSRGKGNMQRSSSPIHTPITPNDSADNDIASRETSTSRSPAQYMSKASSVSSSSQSDSRSSVVSRGDDNSESESGSEYETGSDSEDDSESVAESSSSSGSSAKPPTSRPDRKSLTSVVSQAKSTEKLLNGRSQSRPASNSNLVRFKEEDEERIAKEINHQVRGEFRQSIEMAPPKPPEKSVPKTGKPTTSPALVKKSTNSRFPSLTGLRDKVLDSGVSAVTTTPLSTAPASSKVGLKAAGQTQTTKKDEVSSSSSESEDSSSSSDDQDDSLSQKSVPKTPTPQSRPIKGIRSLLKRMFPYGALDNWSFF